MKKEMLRLGALGSIMILLFMPLACASSADEPQEDYNLLNLLKVDAVKAFYWTGKTAGAECSATNNSIVNCYLVELGADIANDLYAEDNVQLFFSNPIFPEGSITINVADPVTLMPHVFSFAVKGNITFGAKTGENGYARILHLNASGANPVTVDGVQASFDGLTADVEEDGLRGSFTVSFPAGADLTSVKYSFLLKTRL
ncbi:MAG: hypothetical protein H3C43_01535 [Leptonema sp. (in: Bacteria)]|nr:hypothetical protein [Leptonema sp. (in: bacteria)]